MKKWQKDISWYNYFMEYLRVSGSNMKTEILLPVLFCSDYSICPYDINILQKNKAPVSTQSFGDYFIDFFDLAAGRQKI